MPLIAEWITVPIAFVALTVGFLAFLDARRYRRTVTDPQLAVKCQPGVLDELEVLVVNVGTGIAYDITFTTAHADDVNEGFPGWSLDLGDLLPKEERFVMRLTIEELEKTPPTMVALRYKAGKQYGYPTKRRREERPRFPEYQRRLDLRHWVYELKRRRDGPPPPPRPA